MEDRAISRPSAYPWELRERDVRMVAEFRPKHESEYAAIVVVAKKLGIGTPETVRKWIRRAEIARYGEESTTLFGQWYATAVLRRRRRSRAYEP